MRHARWVARLASPLLSVAVLCSAALCSAALPASAATGVARKPNPKDVAVLAAGVVTAADVPAGWTATKQVDTGTKKYQGIKDCRPISTAVTAARAKIPHQLSPDFSPPGAANTVTVVDDIVLAFKTPAAASQFLAAFQGPTISDCLQTVLAKTTSGKAQVSVAELDDLQGLGDANVGYEATISASDQGQSLTLVGDIVNVQVGRAIVLVSYLDDGGQTLPEGMSVVTAVVDRLRFAPGG
jgi:hypothetical protein